MFFETKLHSTSHSLLSMWCRIMDPFRA